MKSVFRFLGLGALAVTFTAVGATESFAQDVCADIEGKQAIYKQFTDNFDKGNEQKRTAVAAAKQYIEKYGACADDKAQVDYLKAYIPPTEAALKIADDGVKRGALYKRFNDALKAKNWDEVYASAKEILPGEQSKETALDVTIVLGSIGFDETITNKNEKYNADTIKYASDAISKIEAGQTSKQYGVLSGTTGFVYKNKDGALSALNYIIGYLNYNTGAKDKKAAVPYLYKATQYNASVKTSPEAYQGIGSYYLDEIKRLEDDRQAKLKAANNVDTDETKAIYAMQRGYAERVIDAYSKAYQNIDASKEKARKDAVYNNIKFAYELRNNNKSDGLTPSYIASQASKPLVDPKTEVQPVVETPAVDPAAPATGTTTAPATAPATKPVTTPAAPATTTTTKPATTTTKPAAAKPAATPKPAGTSSTTKPAPKKKGTR